jgi:hypothetical protein
MPTPIVHKIVHPKSFQNTYIKIEIFWYENIPSGNPGWKQKILFETW